MNSRLMLTAGYGYIRSYPYGDFPAAAAASEHRIFQQALIRHKAGAANWQLRLRLEQRFIGGRAPRYQNRFRYFLKTTIPFRQRWFLALYDEPFVGFGANRGTSWFDHNRAYAAIGFERGRNNRIEIGYLHQLVRQRSGRVFEQNHTLQIGWFSGTPFRRQRTGWRTGGQPIL